MYFTGLQKRALTIFLICVLEEGMIWEGRQVAPNLEQYHRN